MGDSLKDRLSNHSNSFEGLLSLIPARYYYDDESNSQWKKGTASLEERKAESQVTRRKKFDPDVGSSALDEIKRREQAELEAAGQLVGETNEEDEEGDIIIYDDYGNPISGQVEQSVNDLLRLKAEGTDADLSDVEPKVEKSSKRAKDSKQTKKAEEPINGSKSTNKVVFKEKKDDLSTSKGKTEKPVANEVEVSTETETTKDNSDASLPETDSGAKKSKQGIEELRARLAARVNELRAKRKAPGSDAQGAPKNREELLAARKLRLEQKKSQTQKHTIEHSDDEDEDRDNDEIKLEQRDSKRARDDEEKEKVEANLMFGQVQFSDGARLANDASSLEEQRKRKKRNAMDQLRVLENRKSKVSKLDHEKQQEIAENAKWSRAILQSEGAKIRDDEKLLRKTIKQKQNRKKRSEKEWKQRIYNVKKGISDRESKRHANISAHKEAKKLRLKGRKRRDHMKNATK